MTRQSAALFSGLGEGMIAMGGEVQNVFNAERANKVEEIKAQRLASMQQSEHMMSNLFKLDTSRTQKSQFAQSQAQQLTIHEETLKEQKRATEAKEAETEEARKLRERLGLKELEIKGRHASVAEKSLEESINQWSDSFGITEKRYELDQSIARFREKMEQGRYDLAKEELEFQREKFGWTKEIGKLEYNLKKDSLAQNQTQFESTIDIRKQEVQLIRARLEFDKLSDQKKLELLQNRFEYQKLSEAELFSYKKLSEGEQRALLKSQFEHLKISDKAKQELANNKFAYLKLSDNEQMTFLREKFTQEKLNDKDRKALENEGIALRKEVNRLEGLKIEIDRDRLHQLETYQDALISLEGRKNVLATQGLEIREGELRIKEGAADRGKWKITLVPIYDEVMTKEASGVEPAEYARQKVGEKIVVINLDEPELNDIRELQDGEWKHGAPPIEFITDALVAIDNLRNNEGMTFDEAVTHLKDIKKFKSYDWSAFDAMVISSKTKPDESASIERVVPKGTTTTVAPESTDTNRQVSESTRIHRENIQNTPEDKRIETLQAWREDYAKYGLTSDVAAIDVLLSELGVTPNASGIVTGDDTGVITSKGPIHDAAEAVEDTGPTWVPGPRGIGGKWVED